MIAHFYLLSSPSPIMLNLLSLSSLLFLVHNSSNVVCKSPFATFARLVASSGSNCMCHSDFKAIESKWFSGISGKKTAKPVSSLGEAFRTSGAKNLVIVWTPMRQTHIQWWDYAKHARNPKIWAQLSCIWMGALVFPLGVLASSTEGECRYIELFQ